jgi:hypothetical protein
MIRKGYLYVKNISVYTMNLIFFLFRPETKALRSLTHSISLNDDTPADRGRVL